MLQCKWVLAYNGCWKVLHNCYCLFACNINGRKLYREIGYYALCIICTFIRSVRFLGRDSVGGEKLPWFVPYEKKMLGLFPSEKLVFAWKRELRKIGRKCLPLYHKNGVCQRNNLFLNKQNVWKSAGFRECNGWTRTCYYNFVNSIAIPTNCLGIVLFNVVHINTEFVVPRIKRGRFTTRLQNIVYSILGHRRHIQAPSWISENDPWNKWSLSYPHSIYFRANEETKIKSANRNLALDTQNYYIVCSESSRTHF